MKKMIFLISVTFFAHLNSIDNYTQQLSEQWVSLAKPILPKEEKKETGFFAWLRKQFLGEQAKLDKQHLDDHKLRELTVTAQNLPEIETISDEYLAKNLELVKGGNSPQASLSRQVSSILQPDQSRKKLTATYSGDYNLNILLAHPTSDIDLVKKRQDALKKITGNDQLLSALTSMMNSIIESEKSLLDYFLKKDELYDKTIGQLYSKVFSGSVGLEASTQLGHLSHAAGVLAAPISAFGGATYVKRELMSQKAYPTEYYKYQQFGIPIKNKVPYTTAALETVKQIPSLPSKIYRVGKEFYKDPDVPTKYKALASAYGLLMTTYVGASVYMAIAQFKNLLRISNFLQKNLIAIRKYLDIAKACFQLIKKHDLGLPVDDIKKHLIEKNTDELAELIGLLETRTFTGSESLFSLRGRVLRAHKLMEQYKQHFGKIIEEMGIIDAYVAIAQKIKHLQGKPYRYCFVDFVESNKPMIAANDFWNPFVETIEPITNDLTMKDKTSRIVLTGPNTGGKSTLIKALMINCILAQSFGIACARSFKCTPFALLRSYLNVADDTIAGMSLFASEVARGKQIMEDVKALNKNAFSFIIIDEMFSGTSPDNASQLGYDYLKKLSTFNCLFINATHFAKLTELEKEGIAKNYHMGATQDKKSGHVTYTYKIEPGISQISSAKDVAQVIDW